MSIQVQYRQHMVHAGSPVLGALDDRGEVDVLHSGDIHRPDAGTLLEDPLSNFCSAQTGNGQRCAAVHPNARMVTHLAWSDFRYA